MATSIEQLVRAAELAEEDGDVAARDAIIGHIMQLQSHKTAQGIERQHQELNQPMEDALATRQEDFQRRQDLIKRRGAEDNYSQTMRRLQDEYGDEDTIHEITEPGFLPRSMTKYDEDELLKRYAKDIWGEVPESPGALVTLGKTLNEAYYAARQLIPKASSMGLSQEEIDNFDQEQLIWQAADKTMRGELGAMALTVAPGLSTAPFVYRAVGKTIQSQTLKAVGERMAARQAGARALPKTSAAVGATAGAVGIPHSNDATTSEALYQRMTGGAIAGGINYAMSHGLNVLPDVLRTQETLNRVKKNQKDLPVRVPEHVFDVYGSSQAKKKFEGFVGGTGSAANRATSAESTFMDSLRDSTNKVLDDMIGTHTPKGVGARMDDIMTKFFEVYDASKSKMDAAYRAIPDNAQTVTNRSDFIKWRKALVKEMQDENLALDGPMHAIITAFNKLGNTKNTGVKFADVRTFMHKLNKAQQRLYNDDQYVDLRPAAAKLKTRFTAYIDGQNWRKPSQKGGQPGLVHEGVRKWKAANAEARRHYEKFHGDEYIDEFIDEWNKSKKKDITEIVPRDLSNDIFMGAVNKISQGTGPRISMINQLRKALGDIPDFNVERALKEDAINALRQGGVKGADDVDTLLRGVDDHVLGEVHNDLYSPQGWKGRPGLFNAKEYSQLKQLADVRRRHIDPHHGMTSATRDETQIKNSLLGRTLYDTIVNEYGPFGVQLAGKTGAALRGLTPSGVRKVFDDRMNDRIIRRYTAGLMGNYGPQIPSPLAGLHASAKSHDSLIGQRSNASFEENKILAEEILKRFPSLYWPGE